MTLHTGLHDTLTARRYLRILRRRKWSVLTCAAVVPAAAVLFSLGQAPLYRASAEVLLSRQNLAASLTGVPDPAAYQQADRVARTEADLARVPTVAQRVLAAVGLDGPPDDFLDASGVSAKENTDLLEFWVTDTSPALAARLASEYAHQFTLYRLELDTAALAEARNELEGSIARLEESGEKDSPLYAALAEKQQQLRTLEALQTSNASVVRSADDALKVRPRPVRNGALGFVLGLLLGAVVAFLREAFDTRIRSAEEIGERLGLPLLGRLRQPPHRLRAKGRLAMIAEPSGPDAEAFRVLRTNLDFVNLERGARTVMVTSSVASEGKTTTVANLAVALARAGRRVVLVDLDLRHPDLARFFGLQGRPGLTDVALGRVALDQAIVPLAVPPAGRNGGWTESRPDANGHGAAGGAPDGVLAVLPSGPIPPDAGEFVGSRVLAQILDALRERAEFVLVDSAPLLGVGDSLTLSAKVDALIVVTRLKVVQRGVLGELKRNLDTSPAAKLGFVVTDAGEEEDRTYGYSGYPYYPAPERELVA